MSRVWQITACDLASSYGMAPVFRGDPRSAVAARFLHQRVMPHFRKAGFPVQRVLTDRGSEFKVVFYEACRKLGIRHTRTQPATPSPTASSSDSSRRFSTTTGASSSVTVTS